MVSVRCWRVIVDTDIEEVIVNLDYSNNSHSERVVKAFVSEVITVDSN
jgi:deoxycytidylate deaminase